MLVLGALAHVLFVDEYVDSLWKQVLWAVMSGAFVALLVWVRVVKPSRARPWRLERTSRPSGATPRRSCPSPAGRAVPLRARAVRVVRDRPVPCSLTQHPFSFASSAEDEHEVALAVKALGDFTSTVGDLEPGTTVYVDGPHGVFSPDLDEGPGFGLLAGGVGIAGLISILRTMADRRDVRPVVLVYANRDWDGVAFREELAALEERLDARSPSG